MLIILCHRRSPAPAPLIQRQLRSAPSLHPAPMLIRCEPRQPPIRPPTPHPAGKITNTNKKCRFFRHIGAAQQRARPLGHRTLLLFLRVPWDGGRPQPPPPAAPNGGGKSQTKPIWIIFFRQPSDGAELMSRWILKNGNFLIVQFYFEKYW